MEIPHLHADILPCKPSLMTFSARVNSALGIWEVCAFRLSFKVRSMGRHAGTACRSGKTAGALGVEGYRGEWIKASDATSPVGREATTS